MARTKRAVDVSGQTFGRLTVTGRSETRANGGFWKCQCVCGKQTETTTGKLRSGHTRSCGCLVREVTAARGRACVKDRTGLRFTRWTVLRFVSTGPVSDEQHTEARWLCRCDCGIEQIVRGSNLQSGGSKSCGCLSREKAVVVSRMNFAERWALNTLPTGRSNAYGIYRAYIAGAKKRKLLFELRFDDFLKMTASDCTYCGAHPSRVSTRARSNGPWVYNGIDRVDNQLGYVQGNMVPCCYRCNTCKKNHTLTEFFAWIRRIHSRIEGRADRAS